MKGRWRLFRHEAGRAAVPPPFAYVTLYCVCILVGLWSAERFGAIVIWPTNGVMLAALLQLHRHAAIRTVAVCFAINLISNVWRGDPMPFLVLNAFANLFQVVLAAVLVRRVGGAALDLRRPRRILAFGLVGIAPAVALSALLIVTIAAILRDFSLPIYLFTLHRYFEMELLGLLIVTPTLLLIARAHRFRGLAKASRPEAIALIALLLAVTATVFFQSRMPLLFVLFPPVILITLRLSPPWVAVSVILVAVVGAGATVSGMGPISLVQPFDIAGLEAVPPVQRQLSAYYVLMLTLIVTALPISTHMSERQRLLNQLRTRTQAAQSARREAEASNAAKSRFLALMSHEMRTPLHSVVGYAEVLARRPDLKAEARRQADLIGTAGNALLVLVEDVLEVSRGTDILCLDTISLADIVAQAVAPVREIADLKRIAIRIEIEAGAGTPVRTDPKRLRQAIHKLIANAVKFTSVGHVRIHAVRDGEWVTIAVSDTGCGIDPAVLPRIFDAFIQSDDSIARNHVGAGLGLTVARRLVERLDGRIAVESRPGEGSTFSITLPLPVVETAVPGADASESVAAHLPRILVVDDHPANREVARLMLSPTGADIVEACDGQEAVDLARLQTFDLILMDVRMPRMDGLAATQAIRALPAPFGTVPILAVTADAMPEDAERCLSAGMNGHLAKPITHAALYAAIEQVMASSEGDVDAEAA